MRQTRHVGKTKGRRSTFDRMSTTKNAVELLIIGRLELEAEQHLLHQVKVLRRFLEENLIELCQIEVTLRATSMLLCI